MPPASLDPESFFREAIARAPTAIAVLGALRDGQGRAVDFAWKFANAEALRLFPAAAQAGSRISESKLASAAAPLIGSLAAVVDLPIALPQVEKGPVQEHHLRLPALDAEGAGTWVACVAAPLGDGVVATFYDMTEERAIRAEHARQTGILQSMYEQAPFAACVVGGLTPRFEFANEAFLELCGLDKIVGVKLDEALLSPHSSTEILQLLARAHRQGTRDTIPEYLKEGKDGRNRYLRIVAHPVEETPRGATTIQMIAVDVTALVESRLQAEELAWELAEEQELYQATFTDAPVGIVHLDLDRNVTQANERLLELFRCSLEDLLTQGFAALRHPDELDDDEPWAPAQLEGGARAKVERRYLRRDGTTIWTTITVSLVRDRTGHPKRYVAIVEDVSELTKANERLEESSRSKDEFLAVLGHELRNPLAALRHASMVLTDADVGSEVRGVVRIIERQTKHMGRLVDDLLDVGRIAQGKLDFRMEKVDLRQTVSFALDDLSASSFPSQSLELDLEGGPLWVEGDSARLLQAVQNILNNAVKYTPEDGSIRVTLKTEGDALILRVKDSGVGLDPSFAKKLFLPFEQAPQDLSRSQGGLGLGLALTSQIIKHHGGSITAQSDGRGAGATFVIELLCTEPPSKTESARPNGPRRRLRFLVVEDNRDAAELLEMLLTARGHEVTVCHSGDRALQACLRMLPDVVLCDLGLPGLSGFQVAEQIRKSPKLSSAVLVALSGYGRGEDTTRSREAGFSGHLTKPVDLNEIFSLLERLGVIEHSAPPTED